MRTSPEGIGTDQSSRTDPVLRANGPEAEPSVRSPCHAASPLPVRKLPKPISIFLLPRFGTGIPGKPMLELGGSFLIGVRPMVLLPRITISEIFPSIAYSIAYRRRPIFGDISRWPTKRFARRTRRTVHTSICAEPAVGLRFSRRPIRRA